MRRARPAVVLALLIALLPACERGCLVTWLRDHGAGGQAPPSSSAFFPMHGVDCPDGLGRCVGGVVEVSRVSRYELPCAGSPESCVCPWDALGDCPRGCAAEGVETVIPREHAFAQLCAPDPSRPLARPLVGVPAPVGACVSVGYRCVASQVVACSEGGARAPGATPARGEGGAGDLSARAFAACLEGCASEGALVDEEDVDDQAAIRILCAR